MRPWQWTGRSLRRWKKRKEIFWVLEGVKEQRGEASVWKEKQKDSVGYGEQANVRAKQLLKFSMQKLMGAG